MDGTYESIYLVAFILAGPVYNNALKNRAALLCRALRRVNRLCSRTLSDPANRLRKTRKKKSSAVPHFRSGHMSAICAGLAKQGKGRSSKRKGNRRCPFLFAHRRGYGVVPAAGRGTLPPSADGESPAEVQRKTPRPERANTPAAVRVPRWVGAEKELPGKGEPACGSSSAPAFRCRKGAAPSGANTPAAVRVPRWVGAEKELPGKGEPACGSSSAPAFRCRKGAAPSGANTPAAVRVPRSAGAEKEPPRQGEHANAVRAPRWVGAENPGNPEKIFPPEKAAKTPILTPRKRLSERYS